MVRFSGFKASLAVMLVCTSIFGLDLKVMSFNIRYGGDRNDWNNRKDQVWGLIKNQNPLVIGLQEALRYQLDEMMAELTEYTELGVGRTDGKEAGEYSSVLYKTSDFDVDTTNTFWLSSTPNVPGSIGPGASLPRIATWARLIHKSSGLTFYFYSSHWSHVSDNARLQAAQVIADQMSNRTYKEDPVVYVCDCNARINQAPMLHLTGANNSPVSLTSTWQSLYPNESQAATFHGFNGNTSGEPIDYIMVEDGIGIQEAEILHDHVGNQYPSDHYPITANLRFTTSIYIHEDLEVTSPIYVSNFQNSLIFKNNSEFIISVKIFSLEGRIIKSIHLKSLEIFQIPSSSEIQLIRYKFKDVYDFFKITPSF